MRSNRKILLMLSRTLPELHAGVARYAREHNWYLTSNLAFGGRSLQGWKGDGVIASLGSDKKFVDMVMDFGLPVVDLVGTRADLDIPRVETDDTLISKMVADEFIKRGFINFAFWGHCGWPVEKIRREYFSSYLKEANTKYNVFELSEPFELLNKPYEEFLEILADKIRELPKPVGIMAFNDFCGAELIEACNFAGISVPEQVAVIGVNNNSLVSETLSTPISSVDVDMETRGYRAAAQLDKILDGEVVENKHILIPPRTIIHRKSSQVMAVNNKWVNAALDFIRLNYSSDIGVGQVVDAVGVARRTLEVAFRDNLGRSINDEILRRRIEEAKVMLSTSDLSVKDISLLIGFNYQQSFYNAFSRLEGCTPKSYRRRRQ